MNDLFHAAALILWVYAIVREYRAAGRGPAIALAESRYPVSK